MATRDEKYRITLRRILGREPEPRDATPEARLVEAAARLGVPIPEALREYYRLAGEADQANRAHNTLFRPEELVVEDGYLLFMEENLAVVHWGLPSSALNDADPEVWQRVNDDVPEWHPEGLVLSEFLRKNLEWQAGIGEAV